MIPIQHIHFRIGLTGDVTQIHIVRAHDQIGLLNVAKRKLIVAVLRVGMDFWKWLEFREGVLASGIEKPQGCLGALFGRQSTQSICQALSAAHKLAPDSQPGLCSTGGLALLSGACSISLTRSSS